MWQRVLKKSKLYIHFHHAFNKTRRCRRFHPTIWRDSFVRTPEIAFGIQSALNFINVKRAHFSYERHFSSYMYVVKAAETYIRTKNSYVKMLMKLTPGGVRWPKTNILKKMCSIFFIEIKSFNLPCLQLSFKWPGIDSPPHVNLSDMT